MNYKPLVLLLAILLIPLASSIDWNTDSIVGYWAMDEGSGSTLNTQVGSYTFTTDAAGTWDAPGFIGAANTKWDGTFGADGVIISNIDDFEAYSWSLWINGTPNPATDQFVIYHQQDIGSSQRFIEIINSEIRYSHGTGTTQLQLRGGNVSDGGWHHVVTTWENNIDRRLYIDGVLINATLGEGKGNPNTDFDLAKDGGAHNQWFNGSLDEFGYWNRSLSYQEVIDLYNNGAGIGFNNATGDVATAIETIETQTLSLNDAINVTGSSVSSAKLFYDTSQTSQTVTITNLGGGLFNMSATSFDTPTLSSGINVTNRNWWFAATLANGTVVNSSINRNAVRRLTFEFCGETTSNPPAFVNFTFKNETTNAESIEASFISSWTYYAGSGTLTKSLSFSDATENPSYSFCSDPPYSTVFANPSVTYDNDESQPRGYVPTIQTYTNTTTDKVLYLLPTSTGLFVTIQVLNAAGNPISGATVSIADPVLGVVEVRKTADSGAATFFLDPFEVYTVTVSATGYSTFTGTNMFSTTEFTITLDTAGGTVTDGTAGIDFTILPTATFLNNNTDVTFSLELSASKSNLQSYSFQLTNSSGFVINQVNGTTPAGSTLSTTNNTETHGTITMGAVWTVNGTAYQITRVWVVRDENAFTQWSIKNFFDRLSTYLNSGIFGLTPLSMGIIVFLIIFLATGVLSFRFGLNSPIAITAIVFSLVAFFDVALGIFPNPVNAVDNFPTILVALIAIAIIFREVFK